MHFKTVLAVVASSSALLAAASLQRGYGCQTTLTTTSTIFTTKTRKYPYTTITTTDLSTVTATIEPTECPGTCTTRGGRPTLTITTTTTVEPTTCKTTCDPPSTVSITETATSTLVSTATVNQTTTITPNTRNVTVRQTSTLTSTETQTVNSTITETSTSTTSVTATATPGPVVELTAYKRANCGVQQVAQDGNSLNFQSIQLKYDPDTKTSQCAKIGQQSPQSFSWDVVSFADVPSSCRLNFYYSGDSCNDDDNGIQQLNLNNGRGVCRNLSGVAKSVKLLC